MSINGVIPDLYYFSIRIKIFKPNEGMYGKLRIYQRSEQNQFLSLLHLLLPWLCCYFCEVLTRLHENVNDSVRGYMSISDCLSPLNVQEHKYTHIRWDEKEDRNVQTQQNWQQVDINHIHTRWRDQMATKESLIFSLVWSSLRLKVVE